MNRLQDEKFEALLQAFRDAPGNFAAVARAVGIDPRTARRAWAPGSPGRRPIRDLVTEEQAQARVQLHREASRVVHPEADERMTAAARVRQDAADTAKREAGLARLQQQAALVLLASLTPVARDFAVRFGARMVSEVDTMSQAEGARALRVLADVIREASAVGREAVETERLRLGDATQIVEYQAAPSVTDIDGVMARLTRAIARDRARPDDAA